MDGKALIWFANHLPSIQAKAGTEAFGGRVLPQGMTGRPPAGRPDVAVDRIAFGNSALIGDRRRGG